jgi:predicted nucleotidyltransferase
VSDFTDVDRFVRQLTSAGVEFIIVGGIAASLHGAARATYDLDIVYSRDRANIDRLVHALADLAPYLRGAPPGLPFHWDAETLLRGLNFTFTTSAGDIDLIGDVTGGGSYDQLLPHTIEVDVGGVMCRCVTLRALIALKRAAGRPKDFEAIAELEILLEEEQRLRRGQSA